jgi:hypothetical protein
MLSDLTGTSIVAVAAVGAGTKSYFFEAWVEGFRFRLMLDVLLAVVLTYLFVSTD